MRVLSSVPKFFFLFLLQTLEDEIEIVNLSAHGKQSTRIDPYDLAIGDVVGQGSFGVVYRGLYKNTYDVAVKKVFLQKEHSFTHPFYIILFY